MRCRTRCGERRSSRPQMPGSGEPSPGRVRRTASRIGRRLQCHPARRRRSAARAASRLGSAGRLVPGPWCGRARRRAPGSRRSGRRVRRRLRRLTWTSPSGGSDARNVNVDSRPGQFWICENDLIEVRSDRGRLLVSGLGATVSAHSTTGHEDGLRGRRHEDLLLSHGRDSTVLKHRDQFGRGGRLR